MRITCEKDGNTYAVTVWGENGAPVHIDHCFPCDLDRMTAELCEDFGIDSARVHVGDMGRVFKDTESGEAVTMWELLEAFEAGESEAESFGEYVGNCQSHRGGTLEEVRGYRVKRVFVAFEVMAHSVGNYDGIRAHGWHDVARYYTAREAARYIAAVM